MHGAALVSHDALARSFQPTEPVQLKESFSEVKVSCCKLKLLLCHFQVLTYRIRIDELQKQ